MRAELANLEAMVGHQFRDQSRLIHALTHSSHLHEHAGAEAPDEEHARGDNEQLEFLGDSVLGFLISEWLVHRFPSYPEGRLSKLKAHLVSATHLYDVAQEIEIGKYLFLGRGEEMSGGRNKKTLQVDGLEALIAALYLDGGIDAARRFVNRFVIGDSDGSRQASGELVISPIADFKSALQEFAQARKLPPPRYLIVKEAGPEHSKTFTIEVRIGREWVGRAEGLSKKSAAQSAARDVLARLLERDAPACET